jgi:hypothetical protein
VRGLESSLGQGWNIQTKEKGDEGMVVLVLALNQVLVLVQGSAVRNRIRCSLPQSSNEDELDELASEMENR